MLETKITVYDSLDAPDTSGTHLKGYLKYGITYDKMLDLFGQPTFLPEDSGDGKINFEWVVEFETEENGIQLFTIYDWKTPNADWSIENTGQLEQASEWFGGSRWHVGGKEYAGDFIEYVENAFDSGTYLGTLENKVDNKLPF